MNAARHLHHVFLPHAGGAAVDLLPIAKALCDAPNRHLLELPGRGRRRRDALIYDGAAALDDLYLRLTARFDECGLPADAPVVFFGHSFGAYMAWTLARRHKRLSPPARLAVVALSNRPLHRRRHFAIPHGFDPRRDPELLADLVGFVETLGNVPAVIRNTPELFDRFMEVLAADLAVADSLPWALSDLRDDIPLITGHGTADPVCQADQDSWQDLTTGPHRALTLAGGHFLTQDNPHGLVDALHLSDIYADLASPDVTRAEAGQSRA